MIVSKALETSQELNPINNNYLILESIVCNSYCITFCDRFIHTGTADFGVLQLKVTTTIMVRDKGYFHNQNLNIKLQI
jgi:hypothetical protein